MHIVVLTGSYYPYMAPPVGCFNPYLLKIAKDNDVEIICPIYNRHYKIGFVKDGIKINYISSFPNDILSYARTCLQDGKHIVLSRFLDFCYRGGRYIKYLFQKEAYETSLIKHYIKEVKRINCSNKIDVLISISFPFYTHAAALLIKKEFPSLRWVTYTTDPLAYSYGNPLETFKKPTAIITEQNVYDYCNNCMVTEELYPNLIDDYNVSPLKVIKLPFLLNPIEIKDNSINNNRIQVLYAGYVYYKIRNPQLMIEVFSGIPNIDLNMYVAGDRFCRRQLKEKFPDNIHIYGLVSREDYFKLLSKSDVLVNLSNSIPLQAPSKLLELISTCKMVINFYHEKNTGYYIIERYPLGLNVSSTEPVTVIRNQILNFIEDKRNVHLNYCQLMDLFPDHLLDNHLPIVCKCIMG